MALPILATKLYAPPARPRAVRQTALLERLSRGLAQGRRLTLVSAPAGYGKTTLVLEWLSGEAVPFSWLSLEADESDPVRFLTYLLAALRKCGEAGEAAMSLLAAGQLPPVDLLVSTLINDLASVPARFVLVLDDLHTISNPYVYQVLEYFVAHQPSSIHLVLVTREDPPLPLARWRARGQLNEVRVHDLRFGLQETAEFFRHSMGLNLEDRVVAALEMRTEGWVAGLQLAALSLQRWEKDQIDEFVAAFAGSHRYVIDYLGDEVLAQQPERLRAFMRETSILDNLCAPLCNAVTGRNDSQDLLAQLEQANLFLIPLDDQRHWYRYHHLFADVLRTTLSEDTFPTLHLRAAGWYEANGFAAGAIQHALAAGDMREAGRLIAQAAAESFAHGELRSLLRWLQALPAEVIDTDGELSTYKAWCLFFTGSVKEAMVYVGRLEAEPPACATTVCRGRMVGLRAWLADFNGDPRSLELAREALSLLGDADALFSAGVLMPLGHAYLRMGQSEAGIQAFRESYGLACELKQHLVAFSALANLAFTLDDCGRRREAVSLCEEALARFVDARGEPLPLARLILIPLGVFHYHANELDQASDCILAGLEICRRLFSDTMMGGDGEKALAMIYYATGNVQKAFATVRDFRRAGESSHPAFARAATVLEAELRLREGDLTLAVHLVEATGSMRVSGRDRATEFLTLARLRLAQDRPVEALAILQELEEPDRSAGRQRRLLTILLRQAQASWALGDKDQVPRRLEEAVRIAAPEGYVRQFLDEDPSLLALLVRVRHAAPGFVDAILASGPVSQAPLSSSAPAGSALIDPLSERELEILRLIAAGLSNEEIARKLVITLGTAKWHVHNIFSKLDVNRRTQVVARARELDLL